MKQQTFASQSSFEKYGRKSRRELFLDEMELVVPWFELLALVEPHYPKAGNGRRPVGLSIMLRTYFIQQWSNLSGPGVEEAFYESATLSRFAGVDLGVAPAPDETTVLRFRHLLEKHDLCGAMLDAVNLHLEANGIKVQTGTNCRPCNKLPPHANVIDDCETLRAAGWRVGGSHKFNVTGCGGTTQQCRSTNSS